jgi:hypothetical protein
MPPAGVWSTIPASERPQTQSSDRAAAGIGSKCNIGVWNRIFLNEEDVYLDGTETEEFRNELHMHVFQLYHNMDRPVLEPTQPPIQWVPRYFYRSKAAGAWSKPLPSIAEVKNARPLYLHVVDWEKITCLLWITGYRTWAVWTEVTTLGNTAVVPFKGGNFWVQDLQGLSGCMSVFCGAAAMLVTKVTLTFGPI